MQLALPRPTPRNIFCVLFHPSPVQVQISWGQKTNWKQCACCGEIIELYSKPTCDCKF